MEPHQLRVFEEKKELDIKLKLLDRFMSGESFHVVCNEDERIRLIRQSNAMQEYSRVLGERIAAF